MRKSRFSVPLFALVLFLSVALTAQAVPPLPTTLYGKVQEGGADVPDGTLVTAWMESTEPVVTGTVSFPGLGVSIDFSHGCTGDVTVSRQAGKAQVISQDGYTSVYAMDVLGPSDWDPPAEPVTEGMTMTLKISDTVAVTGTWNMGSVIPLALAVDTLTGEPPYTPGNVELLGQVWDIGVDCTGYTATVTFGYDDSLLGTVDEADIAGMARYDPSYNRWEYVAGTVNASANTVTIADVTAFSRWRILASTPPQSVTGLSASKSGSDLVLDWTAVTEDIKGQAVSGLTYNIYRAADDPYFTPGGTPYATTGSTTYTDSGAVGDPSTNYYYVVSAADAIGLESALSDRVAEFDFDLYETTGTDYTWVALPLLNNSLTMASDLEQHIEANCSMPVSVLSVARWNAIGQQLGQYITIPWPLGDFALQAGQAYRVESDVSGADSCVWTLPGTVPRRESIGFSLVTTTGTDYTWITLPLDQAHLGLASDLEQAIEAGSGVNVLSICRWNAVGQQQGCYITVPMPLGDFAMNEGYAYRVEVDASTTWP